MASRSFGLDAPSDLAGTPTSSTEGLRAAYPGRTVLIVNGDDVGITEVFTDATLRALVDGMLSSATIVSNGADARRALALFRQHRLPLGVHLAITGDWAPLTGGRTLRNRSGLMWETAEEALERVDPREVADEWDAQIRMVVDAGLELTHLDSHMLTYPRDPHLFQVAFALAKRYRVPLIAGEVAGGIPVHERRFFALTSYTGLYLLPGGTGECVENRAHAYWQMLETLGPGIHYLFSHQGFLPGDGKLTGDLALRLGDSAFWTSPHVRREMERRGYLVIGIDKLVADFRAALDA